MRASRRAWASSAAVSWAWASRSSAAASSTARPARSLRRVIADRAPIACACVAFIVRRRRKARAGSEQKVAPVQRQVVVGERRQRGAVDLDLDGARVDLDPRVGLVVEHVALGDLARACDREGETAALHVASELAGGCG